MHVRTIALTACLALTVFGTSAARAQYQVTPLVSNQDDQGAKIVDPLIVNA